MYVLTA